MNSPNRRTLLAIAAALGATAAASAQWMALTPPELGEAHLKIDRDILGRLRKDNQPVV